MFNLFVGIDVAKDSFSATGLDQKGNRSFSLTARMGCDGFSELFNTITSSCKDTTKIIAAMESTGCYHINLCSFLSAKAIPTVVVNPLLIANFAKLSLRKTKTDKKDSHTIAKFLLAHHDSIPKSQAQDNIRDLRDIARERESLCNLIAATKNEIKRILQTTFPELNHLANVFSYCLLSFLKEFPSARVLRAANPEAVAKALANPTRGRKPALAAEALIKAAQSSVGAISIAKETILKGKISTLLHLLKRQAEITQLLSRRCESLLTEELKIITSIDGIDTKTGAAFLAEIGSINHFSSHKSLIAYAGIDPTIFQSGPFEGKGRISKRGNRHLRRLIYLMTVNVIRVNPIFRAYFLKRKQDRLPFRKAVMATAHKLIRVIFALLSHRSYFQTKENSL